MNMFYNEAMKVSYLGYIGYYKCGIISKEALQEAKDECTVDRPFLDFRRYATDPPLLDLSRFIPHPKKKQTAPAI